MILSKYTTELRYLLEMNYDLGLNDYPIWEESHREELNKRITEHYKFREIGFETANLFKDRLNTRMREIMPKYCKLYEELKDKKLTENKDIYEEINNKSEQTGTTTSTSKGRTSDTPMGSLGDIYSENYATTSNVGDASTEDKTGAKGESERHLHGHDGTKENYKMFQEMLKIETNLDLLIIRDLDDLFMCIY